MTREERIEKAVGTRISSMHATIKEVAEMLADVLADPPSVAHEAPTAEPAPPAKSAEEIAVGKYVRESECLGLFDFGCTDGVLISLTFAKSSYSKGAFQNVLAGVLRDYAVGLREQHAAEMRDLGRQRAKDVERHVKDIAAAIRSEALNCARCAQRTATNDGLMPSPAEQRIIDAIHARGNP